MTYQWLILDKYILIDNLKSIIGLGGGPGAVVKLPAWKVGDHGFKSHSDLQVLKKQNVSFPVIRKIQYCGEPP